MKTKIFEFDPVIYPFPLLVCKYVPGATAKEIADRFNQVLDNRTAITFSEDDLLVNPTLIAKTVCVLDKKTEEMKYLIILYRPKKIRWGTVSHESLHVVTMIGDWLGFSPPTVNQDEPHAYLAQWVANCIGSVLDGRPQDMNGNLLKFEDNATEKTECHGEG